MIKEVVIFIGPPGSGKGTQAVWLENELGFFHLESTAVIRNNIAQRPDDPVVIAQKELIAKGELVDPPVVLTWMKEAVGELAGRDQGIVFSGSPRTVFEAVGDGATEGLLQFLARLYGPQNVHIFNLHVSEDESVRRNRARRVCTAKGHPIPDTAEYRTIEVCPWDGSPLQRRPDKLDDDENLIRERYQVYLRRTQPVVEAIRGQGYDVVEMNGDNSIEAIHHHIVDIVQRRRMPVSEH
jgi:adenylate kinase